MQGGKVMSGALWARCLVPCALGDSPAPAELAMATTAVKEAMAHRIQAEELRQEAHGPGRPYLDATAVLHGTSPGKPRGG